MLKRNGKLGRGKGLKRGNAVLKRGIMKKKEKSPEQIALEKQEQEKMWEFFLYIWKKRPHFSDVSGAPLGNSPFSYNFDHLLEKSKWPELKYEERNIALVTFEEHTLKTNGFPLEKHKELIEIARKELL